MILNKELKMKKNILFTCLLLTSLLLTACYNSVFYDVRSDVTPESATVSGNITSITRYTVNGTEFLVLAADGGLRYKAVKNGYHDAWVTMSSDDLPFEPHSYDYFSEVHNGEQILKVLADSNTLYLVTASYVNDSSQGTTIIDKVKLYGTQISSFSLNDDSLEEWASPSWTTIIDEDTSSTYFPTYIYSYYNYSAFAVFQTNAPQASHRKVYIRTGDPAAYDDDYTSVSYYEVSGLSAPTSLTISLVDSEDDESDNAARSAVWFNDSVLFFNTLASTTNETYDTEASRFYYTDGDTLYLSSILLGLKRAIEYNCDIINLSLGGTFKNDPDAIDLLKEMILQAENAGIIVVAAVGNSGNSAINYPAGFEEVIGVGSININNEVSWFSQRNDSVFVVAPGENILSLYPDGSTLTDSGTSMAAPIVTSIAALVKEVMPECSSFEFKRILKETAIDIGILGYDIEYGYGKVDIQKIIEDIKEYLPEIIITQGISDDVKQIYIHNNTSDIKFANGYFVNYKDWNNKIMEQIIICSDIALGTGVINVPLYNNYNCFFLWDNMMRPYVQKYLIK